MVKSVQADYIKSAIFGDVIYVNTKLIERKSASIVIYQEIFRDNELLFKGTFKLVFLKDFKPSKIPSEFFNIFE